MSSFMRGVKYSTMRSVGVRIGAGPGGGHRRRVRDTRLLTMTEYAGQSTVVWGCQAIV